MAPIRVSSHLPVVDPGAIRDGMPRPILLRRIQEPVSIAMSELDQTPVAQDRSLVYPQPINVGVRVRVARSQRGDPVRVGDHAVARLDVGPVELQGYPVRRADLHDVAVEPDRARGVARMGGGAVGAELDEQGAGVAATLPRRALGRPQRPRLLLALAGGAVRGTTPHVEHYRA